MFYYKDDYPTDTERKPVTLECCPIQELRKFNNKADILHQGI